MNRHKTSQHLPQRSINKLNSSSNYINTSLNLSTHNLTSQQIHSVSNAQLKKEVNQSVCVATLDKSPYKKTRIAKENIQKHPITSSSKSSVLNQQQQKNDDKRQVLKSVLKSSYLKLSSSSSTNQTKKI